jgi:hypothetical protein
MDACPKCGVNRRHVGVAFPVRRLCKCETRGCGNCDTPAVYVEFQNPVTRGEPKLPNKSNQAAKFSCKNHAPDDLPDETADEEPTPARSRGGRPHIDPMWSRVTSHAPQGANSREKVICLSCGLNHEMRQRVLWNGTYSYCPDKTCNSDMFTAEE